MHFTNYASFEAFVPKRSWMLSKFQMGKMSGEAYLAEAMKLKQGSIGIVREAEHQLKLLQQTDLENELQRIEQAFEQHRRPSIPHPPMVQDFVSQFRAENFGVAARFKPLVLDGPTRFGKSTFAESLFGTENTIFINCQNTLIPPMQRHKTLAEVQLHSVQGGGPPHGLRQQVVVPGNSQVGGHGHQPY